MCLHVIFKFLFIYFFRLMQGFSFVSLPIQSTSTDTSAAWVSINMQRTEKQCYLGGTALWEM